MESFSPALTTEEILAELGHRLQRYRLQQNRTWKDLAQQAGVSVRTLQRAEAGEHPTLETVVRILRALGRLEALDSFLPTPLVSPLQLAALGGRERQRAGTRRARPPGAGTADD